MKFVEFIKEAGLFIILVLLQVTIFNRITLFGVAVPLLYVYFLIKLPIGRNKFYVIISGFAIGLVIDIFINTPGVNAAATTIIASLRSVILNLYYSKNELEITTPSLSNGVSSFLKYTITMVIMHQMLLFLIDSLTLFDITRVFVRIASSSFLTIILIIATDSLFYRKGKTVG